MVAIYHFIPGHGEARVVAQRLMDDLPSGSFLAVTRFTLHFMPDREKVTTSRCSTRV